MPAEQKGCEGRPHHLNLQSTLNRVVASHFDIVRPCSLGCTRLGRMYFGSCTPPPYVIGVTCPLRVLEERERGRLTVVKEWPSLSSRTRLTQGPTQCAWIHPVAPPEEGARRIRSFINQAE